MKGAIRILVLFAMGTLAQPTVGAAQSCAINPNSDFFSNFLSPCYTVTMLSGVLSGNVGGDLTAKYDFIFYRVDPRYELVLYGSFPAARFMSISAADDHQATASTLNDFQIKPLTAAYVNPFLPGVPFQPGQRYASAVGMGGAQPAQVTPGCQMKGENVHVNFVDAALRHPGMSWDGDPRVPRAYPDHIETPSKAGMLTVRRYADASGATRYAKPVLLVRDLTTGCAVPAAEALEVIQVVTYDNNLYAQWRDWAQTVTHLAYERQVVPGLCYGPDPNSQISWRRPAEYIPAASPATGYLNAPIPPPSAADVIEGRKFMRMRLRLPIMPNTPCASGCSMTGNEQLRHWSLSLQSPTQGLTLASLGDRQLTMDHEGYATIIVGVTDTPPVQVMPVNGYTYVNLGAAPNFDRFEYLELRNVLRSPQFQCSPESIPFNTSEHNPEGGFMGEYVPVIDFLTGAEIPLTAAPFRQPNTCSLVPAKPPTPC